MPVRRKIKNYSKDYFSYDKDDKLAKAFLPCTAFQPIILTVLSIIYLWTFNSGVGIIIIGALINELVNFILKNTIREPRPSSTLRDYGFPSSHSQEAFFFATVFSNYISNPIYIILMYLSAATVAYSRYYLNFHTLKQITWGSIIGTIVGLIFNHLS